MPPVLLDEAPAPGTPEHSQMFTASKIPTIMGCGYKSSPHPERDLLLQMQGKWTPPEPSEELQQLFDIGHAMEPVVIKQVEQLGMLGECDGQQVVYTNTDFDFPHLVTIDSVFKDGDKLSIVEVKTSRTSELKEKYRQQVVFQQGISGLTDTAHVAVAPNGTGEMFPLQLYPVEFDQQLFDLQIQRVVEFWQRVQNDTFDWQQAYDKLRKLQEQISKIKTALAGLQAEYDLEAQPVIEALQQQGMTEWKVDGNPIAKISAGRFSEKRLSKEQKQQIIDAGYTVTKTSLDTAAIKKNLWDLYQAGMGESTLAWKEKV